MSPQEHTTKHTLQAALTLIPRFRQLGGEFIWIALGQCIAILGGVVGLRVLTEALRPEDYGELALGMTLASLQHQLIMGPIAGACARYFAPARESGQLVPYLRAVKQLLAGATFLVLGVLLLSLLGLLAFDWERWLPLVLVASLFGLLTGYGLTLDGIQNAARQRIVVAWHQSLLQWLRFTCALAAVRWLGSSGSIALSGYVSASIAVLASQLFYFKGKILPRGASKVIDSSSYSPDFLKQSLTYAWPFATWGVFTWIQLASDRWALQALEDTRSVGFYAVIYQLGYYPIVLCSDMVVQLVLPLLYNTAGYGTDRVRLRRAYRLNRYLFLCLIVATVIAGALSWFFHRGVFELFVGPSYYNISKFLPLMVLSGGLFSSGQIMTLIFMTSNNTRCLLLPKVCTALIGAILNVLGAFYFGLNGVIAANVIFSSIYATWMLYLSSKFARELFYLKI
jgi:O-antigen/teichoic acid export membrane protein